MRDQKITFIPILISILFGMFFLISYSKDEIHLYINSHHSNWADIAFQYITHAGDGLVFLFVFLISLAFERRYSLAVIISALSTLFITALAKQVIFQGAPRPLKYFIDKNIDLRLIEGLDVHMINSFPSGHTTAAFACLGLLSLMTSRTWMKLALILLAIAVAYSRMYLSQHFLEDVFAGAIIGTLIASLSYFYVKGIQKIWFSKKTVSI